MFLRDIETRRKRIFTKGSYVRQLTTILLLKWRLLSIWLHSMSNTLS